tara:strand:- start:2603 stop:9082 length:6480 start_codon:yes stop_codon:yes gene_type:complete
MTLTVGGLTSIYNATADNNYDVPTNPKITKNTAFTQRVFGIIHTDDTLLGSNANTVIEKVGTALLTEYSNLDNTNGHTIRCYDGTNGVDLASIDLTTDTYFVLIHSDDANMHHFAKIDTVENADSNGDSFTFEPKFGNRVAKGTKFMIFKGPSIANSTKIVAITGGLDASTFGANYVVSRPLWYFYNDKTVKDNELDHNTKYFVRLHEASSGNSIDLSASAEKVSFVTMAETHYRVIDSSKYSYVVKLKDNLKLKDDPNTATSNESSVLSGTFTDYDDYNDCFINARRDSDDNYSSLSLNGLTRYTHYRDSPNKSNLLNNVFDSYIEESIDGKAGYSETKVIDNNQILGKKLQTNQDYIIRQAIGTGSFNDWVQVGEIDSFVTVSSTSYFYDLKNATYGEHINISEYFNQNDEIRIGDRVCIVSSRNGNEIVLTEKSRLLTEGKFTTTFDMTTLLGGEKVYRRAFNLSNSNLLTRVKFEDTSLDRLRVVLYSDSAKAIEATVVAYQTPLSPHTSVSIDNTYQLLYLNFENNYHDSDDNGLEYVNGEYVILYEVFTGKIEKITRKIENGNNIVTIGGRNTFSKLVNPIVNRDSLYSLDAIYSSRSPYKKLTSLGTTVATTSLQSKALTFGANVTLTAGTEIFGDIGFIGKLQSDISSSTSGTLEDFPLIHYSGTAHTATKQVIFNKAMASNLQISSSTDLSGAANKGLSFRDGTELDSSGAEVKELSGTSDNTDVRAIGYNIDQTDSVGTQDSIFLAKGTIFSDEPINTLIDFNILQIRKESTNSVVKLAPHVPIALGRGHTNYENESELTFTTIGTTTSSSTVSDGQIFGNFTSFSIPFHTPIYVDEKFVGRLLFQSIQPSSSVSDSFLLTTVEQPYLSGWSSGKSIQVPTSKIHHELQLINGSHLHGGKIIGLLGTDNNIIEFETFDTSSHISYSNKFGNSIFRIFNLEKGLIGPSNGFNAINQTLGRLNNPNSIIRPKGIFNYYATSYKGKNTVKYNISGGSNVYDSRVLPIERRGLRPITYSNYYGRILPNSASLNVSHDYRVLSDQALSSGFANSLEVEDTLYHPSPNAARLFLFANCDIYPYSSTRKDSLMNSATRNIEKYGLLSFGDLLKYDSGENKESVVGDTRRVSHLDSSYSHSSIIESDKTLSSLKRFGLMRLTELVTDYAYNPINPEEEIDENRYIEKLDKVFNYDVETVVDSGGTAISISATSDYGTFSGRDSTVTITGTPTNLQVNDLLVDLAENVIWGEVNSTPTGASVSINVNHLSNNGALYTGTLRRISATESNTVFSDISGKEANSVIYKIASEKQSGLHPNKNMFFASARVFCDDNTGSSLNPNNKFFDKYSEKLLKIARSGENYGMVSPFVFSENQTRAFLIDRVSQTCSTNGTTTLTVQDSSKLEVGAYVGVGAIGETTNFGIAAGVYITAIGGSTTVTLSAAASATHTGSLTFITKRPKKNFHLSRIFKQLDYANLPTIDYTEYGLANMTRHKVVLLKGYSVESGRDVEAGETHTLGGLSLEHLTDGSNDLVVPLYDDSRYSILGDVSGNNNFTSLAGAYSGYKFFFISGETGTSASSGIGLKSATSYPIEKKASGNKTYYQFKFSHKGKYNFLQFLDLTGCYLVPIKGQDTTGATIDSSNAFSKDVHVDNFAYVVSHVYDTSTSVSDDEDFSFITLDVDISHSDFNGIVFKIMQPNPVCFWNTSPKEININQLSSAYTKKPNSSEMYGQIKVYGNKDAGITEDNSGTSISDLNEGILSMYCVIDLDNIGQSNKTVLRSRTELQNLITADGMNVEICASDGETNVVGNLTGSSRSSQKIHSLSFENLKYLQGAVSISETFELKINGDIKNTDKRAIIGATLDISREAEELVEELFIENDISHSLVSSDYSIFASPDFQGSSLYTLAKYLLNLKDKTLFDNAGTITSRDILDSNTITKYEFDDDNIIEYELVDSGFDFYNEIVVYGSSHKAIKKNIRSIKNIGKKTLEVFDKKLKSQSDVDKRAFELLNIHNNDTGNLEIKTHIRDAETVSSGDIVIVEIKQENIPRNLYMVLEMKYEISGLTTLVLGKYKKGVEDRFSELLLSNKQTDSYLRKKDFLENDFNFDFFENIKIKEINLVLRKRTQTGITLGFSHTLNTDTSTIGFGGGTITHTTLLEEDL